MKIYEVKTMDLINIAQLRGKFRALGSRLPKGRVEKKYVEMFRELLNQFQQETGWDCSSFEIPREEVYRRESGGERTDFGFIPNYTDKEYCDETMFWINYEGAVNFLDTLLTNNPQRGIGFRQVGR